MYSDKLAVQFNDVYQKLMIVDVFSIIVGQESLGDVVYRLQERYNGELLFLNRSKSPASMTRVLSLSLNHRLIASASQREIVKSRPPWYPFLSDSSSLI